MFLNKIKYKTKNYQLIFTCIIYFYVDNTYIFKMYSDLSSQPYYFKNHDWLDQSSTKSILFLLMYIII